LEAQFYKLSIFLSSSGDFPKHVLFSELVEKYKSCGAKAKTVVVGAILNYSAILKFEKKNCSMIFFQ
jgi:hypothetical protein